MSGRPLVLLVLLILVPHSHAALSNAQLAAIDRLAGTRGTYNTEEDVYRLTFPRPELKLAIEGRAHHPFMGFTPWVAFTGHGPRDTMIMGDIALLEDEINPAISAALDNGLEVTALHNHYLFDQPPVMFMHVGGEGTVEQLAPAIKKVIDRIKAIRAAAAIPGTSFGGASAPETSSIAPAPLEQIFGAKGETNAGMFKVAFGRTTTMHGRQVGRQMGVASWAAFAGTNTASVVEGEFVVTASELQLVLKSLRKAGINITAIHGHMTEDQPRSFFLHFWGKGAAEGLARNLKATLSLLGK